MNGTAKVRARGLQAPAIIAFVVTLAVGLVVVAVAIAGKVATIGPRLNATNAMVLPTATPPTTAPVTPTAPAYVPPTASYVTPSLTAALPPPEKPLTNEGISEIPTAPTAPAVNPAPVVAAKVSNINLSCGRDGGKVVATLTFQATERVAAQVSAGGDSKRTVASGDVSLTASTKSKQPTQCVAVVDNTIVGPVSSG